VKLAFPLSSALRFLKNTLDKPEDWQINSHSGRFVLCVWYNEPKPKAAGVSVKTRRHLVPTLLHWPWWILLITAVLVGLFFLIDTFDNTPGIPIYSHHAPYLYPWETAIPEPQIIGYEMRYTWAFSLSLCVGLTGLYMAGALFIAGLAERQHRNLVAWTTAAIVFTPVLASIAYLLTWPQGKSLKG
jgi:hypothetical protein